jgi:uncharacterized protein (DUF1499 family)
MNIWNTVVAGLLGFLAIAAGIFLVVGPVKVWNWLGPADLGPVAFETLQRRKSANDALACPQGMCAAKLDMPSPLYKGSATELRAAFARVIAAEPQVERVHANDETLTDRYVQRSKLMHYPDTLVVQFLDRPGGRATLALYSRSQVGESDLGVNRQRIDRLLLKLAKEAVLTEE